MAEGVGGDHAGGLNVEVNSPREEEMEVSGSAGQPRDFPEGVEIIIEGADPVASPASSPFVVPALVGDISSSEEEQQEDMDDVDSDESLECGQPMTFSPGSETQLLGKRARVERGGVESREESSLHIALSGAFPRRRPPARQDQEDAKE